MVLEREYDFACALVEPVAQAVSPLEGTVERIERQGERSVVLHLSATAGPPAALLLERRARLSRK
jgi:hypothetical protein